MTAVDASAGELVPGPGPGPGGVFVLAFAAVGGYLFFSAASTAAGGKALPLGDPVLKG